MAGPIIKRYISNDDSFSDIVSDFGFLIEKIRSSGFEYDLQIRDGYFNLYYKGNSIGKISYKQKKGRYEITIHKKFVDEKITQRFEPVLKDSYQTFSVERKQLHPLFSADNLKSMSMKVKKNFFQEEVIYEQMLMTDNVGRDDLMIIDRQVSDKVSSTKMDLLSLKRNGDGDYQFCILEVKLGNNQELEGTEDDTKKKGVNKQLAEYIERIEDNFEDYKDCYEKNLEQKERLGLIKRPERFRIVPGVLGVVVVMGYSGMADRKIQELKMKDPSIKVVQLDNRLDIGDM
jgi:hypothetical protein